MSRNECCIVEVLIGTDKGEYHCRVFCCFLLVHKSIILMCLFFFFFFLPR